MKSIGCYVNSRLFPCRIKPARSACALRKANEEAQEEFWSQQAGRGHGWSAGLWAASKVSHVVTLCKAFHRLLGEIFERFANISTDQFESEIERALKNFLEFLDLDRGPFPNLLPTGGLVSSVLYS